jgi:hypothetical protein
MKKLIDLNPPTRVHLMVLYLKSILRIRDVYPGSELFNPDSRIQGQKIPDPGVKKAPDPGSGSATLPTMTSFDLFIFYFFRRMFCLASRASWGPLSLKYCMQTLSQYQTMAAGQICFLTDDV